jgi:hypothetical protein
MKKTFNTVKIIADAQEELEARADEAVSPLQPLDPGAPPQPRD